MTEKRVPDAGEDASTAAVAAPKTSDDVLIIVVWLFTVVVTVVGWITLLVLLSYITTDDPALWHFCLVFPIVFAFAVNRKKNAVIQNVFCPGCASAVRIVENRARHLKRAMRWFKIPLLVILPLLTLFLVSRATQQSVNCYLKAVEVESNGVFYRDVINIFAREFGVLAQTVLGIVVDAATTSELAPNSPPRVFFASTEYASDGLNRLVDSTLLCEPAVRSMISAHVLIICWLLIMRFAIQDVLKKGVNCVVDNVVKRLIEALRENREILSASEQSVRSL